MTTPVLEAVGLYKSFGGVHATDDLHLSVQAGELHAVIGPNGAGKTTLISQLCGWEYPDRGIIRFNGRDITRMPAHRRAQLGMARSFQITSLIMDLSVRDNVALAVQATEGSSFRFVRAARTEQHIQQQALQNLMPHGQTGRWLRLCRESEPTHRLACLICTLDALLRHENRHGNMLLFLGDLALGHLNPLQDGLRVIINAFTHRLGNRIGLLTAFLGGLAIAGRVFIVTRGIGFIGAINLGNVLQVGLGDRLHRFGRLHIVGKEFGQVTFGTHRGGLEGDLDAFGRIVDKRGGRR